MSGSQLQLFKGLDATQLQTYITQLQTIKAASNGIFNETAILKYSYAIEGLEDKQAALLLSTQGLTNAQIAETLAINESNVAKNYQAMADAGLLARKQKLTVAQVQENLQTVLGAETDASAAMKALGLSAATETQMHQTVKLSAAKIQETVNTNVLTEAQAQEFAMRTGVILSMKAETASTLPKWIATLQAGTKAVWSQVKATAVWLATTPAGWATAVIVAIGGVIAALNKYAKKVKETSDKAQEAFEKSKERVQSNKEETKSLDELIKKYKELKSTSDIDSGTRDKIKEIQYDIVDLVGAEAKNLDLVNGKLDNELSKLKEISAVKSKQNVEDARDSYNKAAYASDVMVGDADSYGNDVVVKWLDVASQIHKVNGFETIDHDHFLSFISGGGFDDIFRRNYDENIFNMKFVVDTTDIDGLDAKIARLTEFKDFLAENNLEKTELYQNVVDSIKTYRSQYDNELQAANNLVDAVVDDLSISNEKLKQLTVDSIDSFEEYRNKMIAGAKSDKDIAEMLVNGTLTEEALEIAVNNFMATADGFSEWYIKWQESIQGLSLGNGVEISFSSALTTSADSLDKLQSSVKSAADAYTTLLAGNYSSSELLDSIQAINKAASDMGKAIDWESISASGNPLQAIQDAIESVSKTYADSVLSSTGIDTNSKFGQMLANIVQESYKSETALSSLNKQIDSLQSAYNNLTDIVATYNETGYITFDQLQTLLAMEPQYLSCLIDTNGQLQLNEQTMADLAQLRLDETEAQAVQQAITELGQLALQDEKTAVEENAQAFSNAVSDLAAYNEGLAETIGEASVATSVIRDLNTAISGAESRGATDTEIDTVLNNLETKLQLIKTTRAGLNKSLGNIMGGGSGGSSSATSKFSETIDFFERRVEVLDDALSHLKSSLDSVTGSFAKNNLIDAELGITEEKFNNYTDALSMYTQKANEAFSKIPADIASTVKDGAVSLTKFIGDSNEDVVEAIKEYESWTDKITDCTQELEELKTAIRQLELEKFNNIMDDFSNQFDLRGDSKDLISKQIDLLKESGELIGESFFTAQIDQSKKQLELLENEKAQLVNQMSSAINSGRIQAGTEEWLEMVNALSDVDGSILDCKKSIEEFDNSLLELHTEIFNRIQEQFSDLDSEISNILDLFDEFEVSDDKGIWSKEGITQLGLLAQQYELAQYQVQQYNNEIDELNKQYLAGRYSATEYADKLADLSSAQWNAVKSTESAKDAIMDLNETRIENQINGIEKEIEAYKELTDAQIEALKASKDLHDYEKSIAEKTKSITDLERQIAAMALDDSASSVAKRKKLEQSLADAKADLAEAEYENQIKVCEDVLNAQLEAYEKERNKEIDALRESLNDRETIFANSFETVKDNASVVGQEIATIATEHGITVSDALISSWQSGENAIASYGKVLSQGTSAFIKNIMGVEKEVWNLQAQANSTADSLAWMFSTKADNLVNELNMSYYAETTLADMTNALQQSLVNTLERGYDVSSIVNSLNSIADAADRAKRKIDSLNNSPTVPDNTPQDVNPKYEVYTYNTGKVLETLDHVPTIEEIETIGSKYIGYNGISKLKVRETYASGTRNAKEGLRVVNEEGSELVLPKLPSGNYTFGNAGDQILTKAETDNIFEWAKFDPKDFTPVNMAEHMDNLRAMSIPSVLPNNVNNNSVNVHYDSMFKIEGDVIDADRITKRMEGAARKIAKESITDAVRTAEKTRKYGIF